MKSLLFTTLFAATSANAAFVAFNFENPAQTGNSLLYSQADPDGLYDVRATATAIVNDRAGTATNPFTNPSVSPDATGNGYFTTSWDWDDDDQVYTDAQLYLTFDFQVLLAGTTTPATNISLMASTLDNDGANSNAAVVNEFVGYSPGADFVNIGSTQGTVTTLASLPDTDVFIGPDVVEPDITTNPDYVVDAVYEDQSSFTWTSGHLIDGLEPDAVPGAARLGALQLSFEAVPEPSSLLLAAIGALALFRRQR